MVRAPWNRETQGGLAIIIGPTADPGAQIVCSSSAADGRRPEREARLPRPPHLSRPHRHAGFNRTASRTCPSGHDARIEHGSCSDRNSKARERPHQTDKVAAAGYDSAGLPGPAETAGGDAASRVQAVAPMMIAPITAKISRERSDGVGTTISSASSSLSCRAREIGKELHCGSAPKRSRARASA